MWLPKIKIIYEIFNNPVSLNHCFSTYYPLGRKKSNTIATEVNTRCLCILTIVFRCCWLFSSQKRGSLTQIFTSQLSFVVYFAVKNFHIYFLFFYDDNENVDYFSFQFYPFLTFTYCLFYLHYTMKAMSHQHRRMQQWRIIICFY